MQIKVSLLGVMGIINATAGETAKEITMKFYKLNMDGTIEEMNGKSRQSLEQKLGLDASNSEACVLTEKEMENAKMVYRAHKGLPTNGAPWFCKTCKSTPKTMLSEYSLRKGIKRQFASALMKYLQDNEEKILGGTV